MRAAPLSAALLCTVPLLWGEKPNIEPTIESIQAALQNRDQAAASRQLDEALARHPREAGFFNLRGVLHAQRLEYEAARADFQQAVHLAPNLTPAWQNLARACQLTTDRDSSATRCAVSAWQNVLRLRPADQEAIMSLATLYEWQGKFAESLRELEKLPDGEISNSTILALRCADLAGLHRSHEAEQAARRLARNPAVSEADVSAILPVLESSGDPALIVTLLEAVDTQKSVSDDGLRQLAIAYEQLNRLPDARKILERLAAHDSANPQHLFELARIAYLSHDLEGCLGYLAHVRDLTPNDPRVHFLFALVTEKMELPIEARKSLEKALAIEPENPDYNYTMGAILLGSGASAAAVPYFAKNVAIRPHDVKGHFALGVAYFASGNYDACRREMSGINKDPKIEPGALYFLGRVARLEEKYDEAAAYIEGSLKLLPSFAESYTELGRIRMRQGQVDAAAAAIEHALSLAPDSFQANTALLALYQRTHDPRAQDQAVRLRNLDEQQSKRLELMMRSIEVKPY